MPCPACPEFTCGEPVESAEVVKIRDIIWHLPQIEAPERWGRFTRQYFNEWVTSGIKNPLLASAFKRVDRGLFLPKKLTTLKLPLRLLGLWDPLAYGGNAIRLGEGASISEPSVVAIMFDNLGLDGNGRVLEIGAGSGYADALLSQCASEVIAVEYQQRLTKGANDKLRKLGFTNVSVYCGDGALGWPERAPYDSILVSAAVSDVPQALFDQLKEGGVIVLPVLSREDITQSLVVGVKDSKDCLTIRVLTRTDFMPLVSTAHGGFDCDRSLKRSFRIIPDPEESKWSETKTSFLQLFGEDG